MSSLIRTNGKLLARERKRKRAKHRNRETMRHGPTLTTGKILCQRKLAQLLIGDSMIKNIQGTKLGVAVGH